MSRWVTIPQAPVYIVYEPIATKLQSWLQVCVDGICSSIFIGQPGVTAIQGAFKMDYIGTFPTTSVNHNPRRLVYDGFTYFLGETSPLNSPEVGVMGDIQSSTETGLLDINLRLGSILQDVNDVTIIPGSSSVTFNFPPVGARTSPRLVLPHIYNGVFWHTSTTPGDTNLYANATDGSSVLFTLSTNTHVSFTRAVSVVCPDFEIITVFGCHACPIGAFVNISASSTCLSGLAVASTANQAVTINTVQVTLTQDRAVITIVFSQNDSDVSFPLCLSSGTESQCHDVSGVLSDYSPVVIGNGTQNSTSISGGSSGWGKFSNFWKHTLFGNWWSGLLSSIAILFVALLIALFCIVALPILFGWMAKIWNQVTSKKKLT